MWEVFGFPPSQREIVVSADECRHGHGRARTSGHRGRMAGSRNDSHEQRLDGSTYSSGRRLVSRSRSLTMKSAFRVSLHASSPLAHGPTRQGWNSKATERGVGPSCCAARKGVVCETENVGDLLVAEDGCAFRNEPCQGGGTVRVDGLVLRCSPPIGRRCRSRATIDEQEAWSFSALGFASTGWVCGRNRLDVGSSAGSSCRGSERLVCGSPTARGAAPTIQP